MTPKSKILIVDDDPNLRRTLSDILKAKDYLPVAVATGKEALEKIAEELFAVALVDFKLDDMSGLAVMKSIKEFSPATECIMVTGHASQTSAIEAINLGAYSYIIKPYDMDLLLLTIQRAIDKQKTEEALRTSEEKYKALYENAPLSYQSLNDDGCFIDVNPMWLKLLGYERKDVIGQYFGDFLHPDWKPHFLTNFPAFKERGYVNDVQFKIRHKDGHCLDISFEGCIGYHPDGSFKQTYCVFKNITDVKEAEAELLKYQRNLEELVKEQTNKLEEKVAELERMNDLFVGREFRIKELRDKIKELESKRD